MLSRRNLIFASPFGFWAASQMRAPSRAADTAPRGTEYFASPAGDDAGGDGSRQRPWGSLEKAYAHAAAGDVITLRGGVYPLGERSGVHLAGRSGAPGNPITIRNYPGEVPVLDGSSLTLAHNAYPTASDAGGYVLSIHDASWLTIEGLEIRNGPMGGLTVHGSEAVGCHDNRFVNLQVHGCGYGGEEGKGVTLYGFATNNLFLDIDSYLNRDLTSGGADGFQIAPRGVRSTGNVLRGCRAWLNSDDGFDLYNVNDGTQPAAVSLEMCWAWKNGFEADGKTLGSGDGDGFKLGGARPASLAAGGTSGGHSVSRCAAWRNKLHGFDENDARLPLRIVNCTAFQNCMDPAQRWTRNFYFPGSPHHILRNNLSFLPDGRDADLNPLIVEERNSWTRSTPVTREDFASLSDARAAGPRQAGGALPASDFLHLSSRSSLIGAGSDVGISRETASADIGAFGRVP